MPGWTPACRWFPGGLILGNAQGGTFREWRELVLESGLGSEPAQEPGGESEVGAEGSRCRFLTSGAVVSICCVECVVGCCVMCGDAEPLRRGGGGGRGPVSAGGGTGQSAQAGPSTSTLNPRAASMEGTLCRMVQSTADLQKDPVTIFRWNSGGMAPVLSK